MRRIFVLFVAILVSNLSMGQSVWPPLTKTSRPQTRWWWMGNAVDSKNIESLLKEYSRIGIGGVEIVPIYGAKGFENTYIKYLSPQWMKSLDSTVTIANKLNMLVDLSIGSGWPIGGPDVSLEDAATKMEVQKYSLAAGERLTEKIEMNRQSIKGEPGVFLSALMAYSDKGAAEDVSKYLTKESKLNWTPQKDHWTVIALFNTKTFQKVKRAAPGGEGYTLDHFSAKAVNNYISYFDKHFGKGSHGLRALYNDSYEVFNADWSPDFFNEFRRLRGYDLRQYLPQLTNPKVTDELTGRVKSDYRETMSDLVLNNFTRRMTSWAHSKNTSFLNQAHGSPGNLLDLYAAVDIPETETFGSYIYAIPGLRRDMYEPRVADTEPLMFKFASSAAHVVGHNLTSSETHTWLTEHFKTNLALCKPEAENLFLSGVNQIMFHGTTYSPASVAYPGWLFYASVNFNPSNSLWPHLKAYNDYITRCQSVLQAGKPDNEILLYWPVYDLWQNAPGLDFPFRAHNTDVWIHGTDLYKKSLQLKKDGYSYDYVSDEMIQKADVKGKTIFITKEGAEYKTIIVPGCKMMALPTFKKLLQLADAGATIIMKEFPTDVPGVKNLDIRRQELIQLISRVKPNLRNGVAKMGKGKLVITENIINALKAENLLGEELTSSGLQFIRRKIENGYYYYVVNHSAQNVDEWFTLKNIGLYTTLLDPQTGTFGRPEMKAGNAIRLQLGPGESIIVRLSSLAKTQVDWKYFSTSSQIIELDQKWKLRFKDGGPLMPPPKNIENLKLWTDFTDSVYQDFSGTGVYSTIFNLNKSAGNEYLLQLNELYETALVRINGKGAGYIYSVPYQLRIGKYLQQGANKIEIEVCNLMANRIRYMDKNKISWRNYHEINFVNREYKEFDASGWKTMPSGLAGPVRIITF